MAAPVFAIWYLAPTDQTTQKPTNPPIVHSVCVINGVQLPCGFLITPLRAEKLVVQLWAWSFVFFKFTFPYSRPSQLQILNYGPKLDNAHLEIFLFFHSWPNSSLEFHIWQIFFKSKIEVHCYGLFSLFLLTDPWPFPPRLENRFCIEYKFYILFLANSAVSWWAPLLVGFIFNSTFLASTAVLLPQGRLVFAPFYNNV